MTRKTARARQCVHQCQNPCFSACLCANLFANTQCSPRVAPASTKDCLSAKPQRTALAHVKHAAGGTCLSLSRNTMQHTGAAEALRESDARSRGAGDEEDSGAGGGSGDAVAGTRS